MLRSEYSVVKMFSSRIGRVFKIQIPVMIQVENFFLTPLLLLIKFIINLSFYGNSYAPSPWKREMEERGGIKGGREGRN